MDGYKKDGSGLGTLLALSRTWEGCVSASGRQIEPPFTVYERFGDVSTRILGTALIVVMLLPAESIRETAHGLFEQLGLWQKSKGHSFA